MHSSLMSVGAFWSFLLWFVFLNHTLLLMFHFRSHSWLAPLSPQRVFLFTEIWMRLITRSCINCHIRDIETRTSQKKIDWKDSSKKHRLESRWNGLARWHGRPNDTKRVTIVEERDWHKRDERQELNRHLIDDINIMRGKERYQKGRCTSYPTPHHGIQKCRFQILWPQEWGERSRKWQA